MRKDLDYEKSINQSERLRAEEVAQELKQRENMLNMFQYSKDQREKDFSSLPYYQLGFGGQALPGGQKVHEVVTAQFNKENVQLNNSNFARNIADPSTPYRGSGIYNNITNSSSGLNREIEGKRFDYNSYMISLQHKLAEHGSTIYSGGQYDYVSPNRSKNADVTEKGFRFRDKILAKLGNVDDNSEQDFAEGLEMPSDMDAMANDPDSDEFMGEGGSE